MILVSVKKESAHYQKITITGHAMYDDFGKDIVCSAVSSIVTTTVNGILALEKDSLKYSVDSGRIEICVVDDRKTTHVLLENMLHLLKELENNYPKNVQVK